MVGCHLPRSSKERIHGKQLTSSLARLFSTRPKQSFAKSTKVDELDARA